MYGIYRKGGLPPCPPQAPSCSPSSRPSLLKFMKGFALKFRSETFGTPKYLIIVEPYAV